MLIEDITRIVENFAPLALQESYDNAGLIVGDKKQEVTGALLCLDSTEAVIDEAIALGCNLVIAHHPIVFSGLKKINGKNYIERVIIKAIKNNIAIYACHTNIDNVMAGVNNLIAAKLGLKVKSVLSQKENTLRKLVTFCPNENAESVRKALFEAGCGNIGNYSDCSFNTTGTGTFTAQQGANPHVGEVDKMHFEAETRIETVFLSHNQSKVLQALFASHPYEEVSYDIYSINNSVKTIGSGVLAEFESEMDEVGFLKLLKSNLKAEVVRHTQLLGKKVKKIAICGGSGSFLLNDAIAHGADVFLTADYKYHQFFDADNKIVITDIGHYETEQFTPEIFYAIIREKFPTFALHLSKIKTNPINYF